MISFVKLNFSTGDYAMTLPHRLTALMLMIRLISKGHAIAQKTIKYSLLHQRSPF